MLIKNLTPFLCGATVTSTRPPLPAMSVVVRATYALGDDGSLTPVADLTLVRPLSYGTYALDDEDAAGACLYPGDFAGHKPRAEVLAKATCFTPRGAPMRECGVQIRVGEWSKGLRVVGRQLWDAPGDANLFTEVPIAWAQAWGGSGFAKNPDGKGVGSREMPNVIHGRDVVSKTATLEPASFGALNPRWPQRASKLGSDYGAVYRRTRAPYFSLDFDWSYFQEAPPDQWLSGYLRGDEEVSLQNLHPRIPLLATRLPGVVVRAFFRDDRGAFREIVMSCDTLFADLDASRIELSWRGVVDVREDDLEDVRTLLVVSEPLGKKRLDIAHYEAAMAAFEADPTGTKTMLAQLARAAEPSAEKQDGAPAFTPLLDATAGGVVPPEMRDAVAFADAAVAHVAGENAEVQQALQERALSGSRPENEQPPVARTTKPGAMPYLGLRRNVREIVDRAKEARQRALDGGISPERLGKLAEVESIANDPRWKHADPSYTPPEPLSTDPPGPDANLVDRDLRGADLAGKDLRGANLEGAILIGANLEGALLTGARMYGTTLYRACLRGADLSGADLTLAHVGMADGTGARFNKAILALAFFEDADLSRATFSAASGEHAVFTRANLSQCVFRDARLPNVDFDDAELSGADLVRAMLAGGKLQGSRLVRADLSGADVTGAAFSNADLSDARFFDARGDRAIFLSARAPRAIFAFSKLRGCHMDRLQAAGADFHAADLRHARLYRAACEAARFSSANLFCADLSKARLDGASFAKASMFETRLLKASMKDCDLSGANMVRCVTEPS